jgi:crotonobetainyl-CoA:carnitine CoA-transferase CaiB-like acyl-CoA transferase
MPAVTALPLQGIRVIDFGQYVAGPLAGMLLAEQGAEVIRIDPPDLREDRRPADVVLGRGKKAIRLDLRSAEDKAVAASLIRTADVLIENFRPGVLDGFGFGVDEVRTLNPRLVYLSLPGFASNDRRRAHVPGWDGVIGAATALYRGMNMLRGLLDMAPVYTSLPLPSVYAGVQGALAVTAALYARAQGGKGSAVEVPLANAMMSAMGGIVLYVDGQPSRYDIPPIPRFMKKIVVPLVRRKLARKSEAEQEAFYDKLGSLIPPMMDSYRCRDGRLLFVFALDHARMGRELLRELNILERFVAAGLTMSDPYAAKASKQKSNLADASSLAMKWRKQLRAEMKEAFLREDAETWEARLNACGIPCAMQRSTAEWLDLPEARQAGLVEDIVDPVHGVTRVPGPSLWLQDTPRRAGMAAPAIDADGAAIRAALQARAAGPEGRDPVSGEPGFPPLRGIQVLDLSTMVAGPVCARTLGDYGAEVIKVDSPQPWLGPRMTCWYGLEVNQGKKSVLLDLKKKDGLNAFKAMVRKADVVIHNMRPSVAERLGIDAAALRAIKPDLIYCNISAYATGKVAAWDQRPGYDPVLQAATGIMIRFGESGRPEMHGVASCVDYLTGFNAAFGIVAALLNRRTRGVGAQIHSSLAQGAQLAQVTHAYSHQGRRWSEPTGQMSRGAGPLDRMYKTQKGWLYLVLTRRHAARLLDLPQFSGLHTLLRDYQVEGTDPGRLDAALDAVLRGDTAERWEAVLQKAGLGAHRVLSLDDLRQRHRVIDRDRLEKTSAAHARSTAVVRHRGYPEALTAYVVQAAVPMFSDWDAPLPAPAPKLGRDTAEVLRAAGFSEFEVQRLVRSKAAAQSLSDSYLPK